MQLTLFDWNLKTPGGARHARVPLAAPRAELIAEALAKGPSIIGLQELTPGYAESLEGIRTSLALRSPGRFDGGNRMLGVGLLVSPDVEVRRWGLIDRAPFPERTLSAELVIDGRSIHVVIFHSLTGVGYKQAKAVQFRSIAEHLVDLEGDIVLMGDANEPKVDARDIEGVKFWEGNGKGAELLFGHDAVHGLKDAWRAHLGPSLSDAPQEGPLAVSHYTRGTPRRYDHIYIPSAWSVVRMSYDYDSASQAGSDHALVTATVEIG